jgi:hypothetical protein
MRDAHINGTYCTAVVAIAEGFGVIKSVLLATWTSCAYIATYSSYSESMEGYITIPGSLALLRKCIGRLGISL